MKISAAITLAFVFTCLANAHHCNEFTSANISSQRHGWFGRTRRIANPSKEQTKEEDLIHRHDMHSFTGTEGIDHHSMEDTGDNEVHGPRRAHKKMLQMSDNLLRRHDMHSYTSLEGMDHMVPSKSIEQHDEVEAIASPVRNSRRGRIDRARSPRAATKHVKQVQQKHEGEYPVAPVYDLQFPLYPYLL